MPLGPLHPYAARPGCPLCTIVTSSSSSPSSSSSLPEVIYRDADVTAYVERKDPVSSRGHIVIVFNLHVPSLYSLSSTDLPLLSRLLTLSASLLSSLSSSVSSPPASPSEPYHIGFISPPLYDPKLPVRDHLHLHAYLGARPDRVGWLGLRALAFGMVGWYELEDLIAEIRETTSNNRVKSGYTTASSPTSSFPASIPPRARPISLVPSAGAARGLPNGVTLSPGPGIASPPSLQNGNGHGWNGKGKGKGRASDSDLPPSPAPSGRTHHRPPALRLVHDEMDEEADLGEGVRLRRVGLGLDEGLMGSPLPV